MFKTIQISRKIKRTVLFICIFFISIYVGVFLKDEDDNWLFRNINKMKIENFGFINSKVIIEKIKLLIDLNKFNFSEEDELVEELDKDDLKPHFPVVIIPGIGASVLELTDKNNYRQKVWGSLDMLKFMALNKKKWIDILTVDEYNGIDALEGIEGIDFIIPYHSVWSKFIRIISSTIGYNSKNLFYATYDWRLSPHELEERNFFLTNLKSKIECMYKINRKKIVIITHSYGSIVYYYFMNWVNNIDKKWVDTHIDSFIPIAAPFLGAPKTISALLSGEVFKTRTSLKTTFYDFAIKTEDVQKLARSLGSFYTLLPKGDNIYKNKLLVLKNIEIRNTIIKDVIKFLLPPQSAKKLDHHQYGSVATNKMDEYTKWSNPLLNPLPYAPDFKIYLLYGVGKMTQCGFYYNKFLKLDHNMNSPDGTIENGIYYSDGDGSVPLISLGYMGIKGWKSKELNKCNIKITVKEYLHQPSKKLKDIRGGPKTADHIDCLVNHELIKDLVHKICNKKNIEERIHSEIENIC